VTQSRRALHQQQDPGRRLPSGSPKRLIYRQPNWAPHHHHHHQTPGYHQIPQYHRPRHRRCRLCRCRCRCRPRCRPCHHHRRCRRRCHHRHCRLCRCRPRCRPCLHPALCRPCHHWTHHLTQHYCRTHLRRGYLATRNEMRCIKLFTLFLSTTTLQHLRSIRSSSQRMDLEPPSFPTPPAPPARMFLLLEAEMYRFYGSSRMAYSSLQQLLRQDIGIWAVSALRMNNYRFVAVPTQSDPTDSQTMADKHMRIPMPVSPDDKYVLWPGLNIHFVPTKYRRWIALMGAKIKRGYFKVLPENKV